MKGAHKVWLLLSSQFRQEAFWIAKTPVNGDGLNTVERSPKISEQLNSISNTMANNRVAPS